VRLYGRARRHALPDVEKREGGLAAETENRAAGNVGAASAGTGGRSLLVARAAWLTVTVLAVGLYVAGTFPYWVDLREICSLGAEACSDRGLLTLQNVRELENLGLSVGFHAAFEVVLTTGLVAVYLGSVVSLQYAFRALAGQGSDLAVVASTLAIAGQRVPRVAPPRHSEVGDERYRLARVHLERNPVVLDARCPQQRYRRPGHDHSSRWAPTAPLCRRPTGGATSRRLLRGS